MTQAEYVAHHGVDAVEVEQQPAVGPELGEDRAEGGEIEGGEERGSGHQVA